MDCNRWRGTVPTSDSKLTSSSGCFSKQICRLVPSDLLQACGMWRRPLLWVSGAALKNWKGSSDWSSDSFCCVVICAFSKFHSCLYAAGLHGSGWYLPHRGCGCCGRFSSCIQVTIWICWAETSGSFRKPQALQQPSTTYNIVVKQFWVKTVLGGCMQFLNWTWHKTVTSFYRLAVWLHVLVINGFGVCLCCLFFSVVLGFSSFHSSSCCGGVPIATSRGIMGGQPKQAAGKHRIRGDINTLIVGAPCDAPPTRQCIP